MMQEAINKLIKYLKNHGAFKYVRSMSDMGWGRDMKVCANAQHVVSIQKPIMPLGSQVSN